MKGMRMLTAALCLLALCTEGLLAAPVSKSRALELAGKLMAPSTRAGETGLKVLWDGESVGSAETPALYVIGRESGGFMIVAGDDRVYPVLAISDKGSFKVDGMPENVRWWMERMKAYVRSVQVPEERAVEAWSARTRATAALPGASVTDRVERLTPTWDQGNNDGYYFGKNVFNAKCPMAGSTQTITGCVATALGEVLTYESGQEGVQMPASAHGTVTSYTTGSGGYYPTFPYGLGTIYDWTGLRSLTDIQAIRDALNAGNTVLLDNLAQLLADLGAIVHASYNTNQNGGTSASVNLARLVEHLDINKRAHIEYQDNYSDRRWVEMLKSEIDLRPVLVSGHSVTPVGQYSNGDPYYAGHQFIFDGYGTYGDETVFHVNFGWGGSCNGYYRHLNLDTDLSSQGRRDYSRSCDAVFDFYPDANSTYAPMIGFFPYSSNGVDYYGLYTTQTITAGKYFSINIGPVRNQGACDYAGKVKLVVEDANGQQKGNVLYTISLSLNVGYFQWMSRSVSVPSFSFGDRIVAYFSTNDAATEWEKVVYPYDGTVVGELPLMPATFIQSESAYAVGDYFEFRLKNNKDRYTGTVWTVTAPDGTKATYSQADREFPLSQAGKYKIDAAVAAEVGGTVTEHVVTVITVQ